MATMNQQVEDDDDDSSSVNSELTFDLDEVEQSPETRLADFRSQWQNEIRQSSKSVEKQTNKNDLHKQLQSKEEMATVLFLQGTHAEGRGKLYEAIDLYRRAVQLVPDIEFRVRDKDVHVVRDKPRPKERTVSECSTGSELSDGGQLDQDVFDMIDHFQNLVFLDNAYCMSNTPTQVTHFSDLPREVIMYILRWVVTSDLDVNSLENFGMVCHGFYVCSRDSDIWKRICQRVWGQNCGRPIQWGSYRNMYIERSHLRFNGLYIAKVSYYRPGEKSLDHYYKPYHLVEYYRYIRFFPGGHVLMLSTPNDPFNTVNQLRLLNNNTQGILVGYYKHVGDMVTVVVKRRKTNYNKMTYYRQRRGDANDSEQIFHAEFQIQNLKRKSNYQLVWQNYKIQTKYKSSEHEEFAEFDLNNNYPNLIFSRVKSYTRNIDKILA